MSISTQAHDLSATETICHDIEGLSRGLCSFTRLCAEYLKTCGFTHDLQHFYVDIAPSGQGDVTFFGPFKWCRRAGKSPHEISQELAAHLESMLFDGERCFDAVRALPSGYVNATFTGFFWASFIEQVLRCGSHYGWAHNKADEILIEFVSANPTGPLHIGHARIAVYGDTLVNILATQGHTVIREYYINDAGGQMHALIQSVWCRYNQHFGVDVPLPDNGYAAPYVVDIAEKIAQNCGDELLAQGQGATLLMPDAHNPVFCYIRDETLKIVMEEIHEDLEALAVRMDVWTSESSALGLTTTKTAEHEDATHTAYSSYIDRAVRILEDKGLVYEGTLPKPKDHDDDWAPTSLTLFASSRFGDTHDRPLKKTDGTWTYFAGDVAYHLHKVTRCKHLIDIFGADHHGYVARIQAAVKALDDNASCEVYLCQMVSVREDGALMRLSKRAGQIVTLRSVVEAIGADALRLSLLSNKVSTPVVLDIALLTSAHKDNPSYYIQYAYARTHSAEKMCLLKRFPTQEERRLYMANEMGDAERAIMHHVLRWPKVLQDAATNREPYHVASFAYQLASAFHCWWNEGKSDATKRFIQDNAEMQTVCRMEIVRLVQNLLEQVLHILGVQPVKSLSLIETVK